MSTILLLHGAWHGAWCFDELVAKLDRTGHKVIAPDLPGHGADATPVGKVGLEMCVARVLELAESGAEPVVAVGHSMAGALLAHAAERRPERFRALAFLTAFLLPAGDSISRAMRRASPNRIRAAIEVSADRRTSRLDAAAAGPVLYNLCPEETARRAAARLGPEAQALFSAPWRVTAERFGQVPRLYIECLEDQTVPLSLQREMQSYWPCRRVYSLACDHSPFLSAPVALAQVVEEIALPL